MFDEGCFKDDREQVARHVSNLMKVMQSESKGRSSSLSVGDPLLRVFQSVWDRIVQVNQSSTQSSSTLMLASSSGLQKVIIATLEVHSIIPNLRRR